MPDTQHTQCPECQTIFRVTNEQLETAQGRVRCGHCMTTFNARDYIVDTPTDTPAPAEDTVPTLTDADSKNKAHVHKVTPSQEVPEILAEDLAAEIATTKGHGLVWGLGVIVLLMALTFQYAWFMRHELMQYRQLQPYLVQMCDLLQCEILMERDVNAIRLISRNVITHPRNNKIMLIQATFLSTAAKPQPYPVLQVKLADNSGQTIAMRRFKPEEYIDSATEIKRGMTPDIPVSLILEVLKPEKDVNTFFFDFL